MEQLILAKYVKRIAFNGGVGDYVRMPKISRLGVNNKLPKSPVTYQAVTEGKWDMRVDTYREASFMIEDILEIQSNVNLRSEYTRELGHAMARDIDNAILGMRASFVNVNVGGSSHINVSTPLSDAEILTAIELMDIRRIPREGRVLIVSPSQHADLIASGSKFTQSEYIGNAGNRPLLTGVVGQVYGVPVVVTDNMTVNGTNNFSNGDQDPTPGPSPGMTGSMYYPTQFDVTPPASLPVGKWTAMLTTPDALAMAMVKMPNVETDRDIDYQATKVVTTQLYGIKPYREDGCILISTQ
jgi:N4-gp56 family major capsid protein